MEVLLMKRIFALLLAAVSLISGAVNIYAQIYLQAPAE